MFPLLKKAKTGYLKYRSESEKIAIIGHSRGATGALYFALNFPDDFSSVISSAFVSDYAFQRLTRSARDNLDRIRTSNIQIKMLIGTQDRYVPNEDRQGNYMLSKYFKYKGIRHDFAVLQDKPHKLSGIWEPANAFGFLQFCANSWD